MVTVEGSSNAQSHIECHVNSRSIRLLQTLSYCNTHKYKYCNSSQYPNTWHWNMVWELPQQSTLLCSRKFSVNQATNEHPLQRLVF